MDELSDQQVEVGCAFCGAGVEYTDADPIAIGVVERGRPYDEQSDGTLYAHRSCFAACLHPDIRELLEDEGDEQPRTEVPF
jgi:hypothetical protein